MYASMTLLNSGRRFLHAFNHVGMCHVLAVPGKTSIPLSIYDDQASETSSPGTEHGNRRLSRLAGCLSTPHKISCTLGNQQANKIFTVTGRGNGGILIGIEATTHKRRIAHASRVFIVNASRRGRSRQCIRPIDGYCANRAMFLFACLQRTHLAPEKTRLPSCFIVSLGPVL